MEISLSLGFLKKPLELATKKIFLKAYQVSDDYYWEHYRLGKTWRELGPDIEYDTHLATIFSNDKLPLSYIVLRSRNGTKHKKVTLKVEAKDASVDYQETIVVYGLDEKPIIKSLPSIPLKSMWVARGGIKTPYNNIHIEIIEQINEEGVDLIENRKIEDYFIPTYTEILNSEFVKRWDYFWNVDEINWQKQKIKDYLFVKLIFSAGPLWRPISPFSPRAIIFKGLSSKPALSIAFWSRNLICAKQIRASVKEQNEEARGDVLTI